MLNKIIKKSEHRNKKKLTPHLMKQHKAVKNVMYNQEEILKIHFNLKPE